MLREAKKDFMVYARRLDKPYEEYKIDELATLYCRAVDTNNEWGKSAYISALILRFWYIINKMYLANPTLGYSREDFLDVLLDGIYKACEPRYRAWMNPEKNVNAQQCINMCIATKLRERYYFANLDKHRANQNVMSLDSPLDNDIGDTTPLIDKLATTDNISYCSESLDIVQEYINQNKIVEAIILDTIAFTDSFKHNKTTIKEITEQDEVQKYIKYDSEFWPYKVVQNVSKLPADYAVHFTKRYNIAANKLSVALEAIRKASNQKLYKYLDKTLADVRAVLV